METLEEKVFITCVSCSGDSYKNLPYFLAAQLPEKLALNFAVKGVTGAR